MPRFASESDGFRFFGWDSEIALALSSRTRIFENNLSKNADAAQVYGKCTGRRLRRTNNIVTHSASLPLHSQYTIV